MAWLLTMPEWEANTVATAAAGRCGDRCGLADRIAATVVATAEGARIVAASPVLICCDALRWPNADADPAATTAVIAAAADGGD